PGCWADAGKLRSAVTPIAAIKVGGRIGGSIRTVLKASSLRPTLWGAGISSCSDDVSRLGGRHPGQQSRLPAAALGPAQDCTLRVLATAGTSFKFLAPAATNADLLGACSSRRYKRGSGPQEPRPSPKNSFCFYPP